MSIASVRKWEPVVIAGKPAWVRNDPPARIAEEERKEGHGSKYGHRGLEPTDRQLDAERKFMDKLGL